VDRPEHTAKVFSSISSLLSLPIFSPNTSPTKPSHSKSKSHSEDVVTKPRKENRAVGSALKQDGTSIDMSAQPAVISQLRKIIWHSLDNHLLSNAVFMAERLVAYDSKNLDSTYLLALCYFRDGKIRPAEHLTESATRHVGCVYIYAQCCLQRKRFVEGSEALERTRHLWTNTSHWSEPFLPLHTKCLLMQIELNYW